MGKIYASTLVDLAKNEIGVKESPPDSNKVKYNKWYYGKDVSGAAYPWCCAFISWLFYKANAQKLLCGGSKVTYCPNVESYARKNGQWYTVGKVGDLVLFDFSLKGIAGHIGIVEKVNADGTYTTIEGNTSAGNNVNGGQVQRRTRNNSVIRGFYRPKYDTKVAEKKATITTTPIVKTTSSVAKKKKVVTMKVTAKNGLYCRKKADADSKIVGSFVYKTKVTVIEKTNKSWYKVNANGITGYCSAKYLK